MKLYIYIIGVLIFIGCQAPNSNLVQDENQFDSSIITDSVFTGGIEGPATNNQNELFVVNFQKEGSIGKLKSGSDYFELFVELQNGSVGNGIRILNDTLYIADYVNHNILKLDAASKNISIHAHNDKMNQPNDLTLLKSGVIYASDPNWKASTGNVWKIETNGSVILMDSLMGTTNGIEVSPDQRYLYVNESVQRKVWRYSLDENQNIQNKELFYHFEDFGMDGMRCNQQGDLFIARYGAGEIAQLSKEGKLIRIYRLHGQKPTNVTFDAKERFLYVTLQDMKWIEKIDLQTVVNSKNH